MYGRGQHPNSRRGRQPLSSPWLDPAIAARLEELCAARVSNRAIAEGLSYEFERDITKNAVISRRKRKGPRYVRPPDKRIPKDRQGRKGGLWARLEAYHDKLDDLDYEIEQKRHALYLRL